MGWYVERRDNCRFFHFRLGLCFRCRDASQPHTVRRYPYAPRFRGRVQLDLLDRRRDLPAHHGEVCLRDLALDISLIHDAAHAIWDRAHECGDVDHFDCKLCGATMYLCIDYTHKPDCPYERLGKAIDKFGDALASQEARTATLASTPTLEP